jgi:hypothetical protein
MDARHASGYPPLPGVNMKKLTAALAIAAVVCLIALPKPAAAGVQFGIKAGGNMAKPTGADVDAIADTLKNKVGFVGGIFVAFNLSHSLSIQTEVLYTMKGAGLEETTVDGTVEGKLYGDYLEIPLLLKLKFLSGGIQPFIFAGPYVGFKLSEKLTVMGEEIPTEEAILKNNDYGAIFGAGLQLGRGFHVDARYSMGLQKVLDAGTESIDFKNGVWSATVGFAF